MTTDMVEHHFNYRHGQSGGKSSLYGIWQAMKNRCRNPNQRAWPYYGGRGITVCAEWVGFAAFRDWALCNGYAQGLSIDRIDVDGNYAPENCRWVPKPDQPKNTSRCIWVVVNGNRMLLKDAAKITNVPYSTVCYRVRKGIEPMKAMGLS